MPKFRWTAYYHFTNPLCLLLTNTHDSVEKNKDMLYRLTTTLTPRQFTYVGYKKLLKTFTAPRANQFTIDYYDHNIIRPNQDQFLDEDRFANPHLTEKFFVKTSYVLTLNIFDRKYDHIISESLADIQAYESFYDKFQLFSLTFHILSPHERNLHCSHDIMLRTKQTHTYTYYRFIQNHFQNPLFNQSHQIIFKHMDDLMGLVEKVVLKMILYKTIVCKCVGLFSASHNIIRHKQDQFLDEDRFANPIRL